MKKIYSIVAGLLLTASVFGQAPQKMSYQAVIRNSSSALVTSTSVGMKISVLQGSSTGTVAYSETQTISTNANGLVSLEIGSGSALAGTFAGINWATGPYFIKTETDPTGGTTYSITGTSQLMSVPYALFSASGTTGAQGIQGIQGLPGSNGTTGAIGLTGANGTNGTNGTDGATGSQGIQGSTGPTGTAGTNGAAGLAGTTGLTGAAGTDGATGLTGAAGTNGADGATGLTGATGSQGIQGSTGPTGTAGTNGAAGLAGTTGLTGAAGTNGADGATGSQGIQGDAGATGTAGTNGTVGLTGAAGAAGVAGTNGADGATGLAGATGTNGLDGATGLAGATGTNGLDGATGLTGAAGLPTSVNAIAQIDGNITLTTTYIPEGDNKYYTDALVSANADVILNTLKVGQASGTVSGDMQYWNGTAWVVIATTPNEGATLQLIGGIPTWVGGTPLLPPATVGDFRAGGIVFWVNPFDNTHGLVCALQDSSNYAKWGCYGTDLPNVPNVNWNAGIIPGVGVEIGDGINNTNNILNDCPSAPAALAARSLGPEWFLPSIYELNQMYLNRTTLEAAPGFIAFDSIYWSSTESDRTYAYQFHFNSRLGYWSYVIKDMPNEVRAVRYF
jgi:hypothetical protein